MKRLLIPLLPLAAVLGATIGLTPLANAQEAFEPLLRGPIHEGFAEPISINPTPTVIAPRRPPELIDETPAEVRPRDESAIWLPGYWAWDQDRDGFIWVSGTWRVPPPDRRWLPGYWVQASDGYQWVPGFWASVETQQIAYLPTPPEAPETAPTSDPPGPDYIWVNGCWLYQDNRFAWRPGYWHRADPDFVWVPSHYAWTPGGVIFVSGYWDYPLGARGFVYAPVLFRQVAGVRYSPSVWLDVSNLAIHMFVNPRSYHYYFGDYYGDRYVRTGYYPWYSFHAQRHYDPLLGYYSARYRANNIDYVDRLRGWHQYYVTHEDLRPPRTLVDQRQFITRIQNRTDIDVTNINNTIVNTSIVGRPVQEALERNPRFRDRSERVSQEQMRAMLRESQDLRGLVQERQRIESRDTAGVAVDARKELRLPKLNEDLSRRVTARRVPLPDVPEQGGARGVRDGRPDRLGDRRDVPDTGLPNRGDVGRGLLERGADRPGLRPDDPRDIRRPGADVVRPDLPGTGRDGPRPGFDRGGDRTPDLPGRGRTGPSPGRGRESGPSDPWGGPGLAPDARTPARPDIRTPGGPGLLPEDANRPGAGGAPDPRPPAGRDRPREAGPGPGRGAGPGLAPDARVPSRPDIRTPGGPGLLPEDANRPGPGGARVPRDRPPREVGPGDPRGGPSLAPDARVPSRTDIRTPGGPGLRPDDADRPGPGGARGGGRERSADRDDRRTGGPPAGAVGPLASERPRADRPAAGRLPQPSGAVSPGASRPEPRKIDQPAVRQPTPPASQAARPDVKPDRPAGGRPAARPDKPDKQPDGKDKDKDNDDDRKGRRGR